MENNLKWNWQKIWKCSGRGQKSHWEVRMYVVHWLLWGQVIYLLIWIRVDTKDIHLSLCDLCRSLLTFWGLWSYVSTPTRLRPTISGQKFENRANFWNHKNNGWLLLEELWSKISLLEDWSRDVPCLQIRSHWKRGMHHIQRQYHVLFPTHVNPTIDILLRGNSTWAGPHVVRQPRHNGVVEWSLAQRKFCHGYFLLCLRWGWSLRRGVQRRVLAALL